MRSALLELHLANLLLSMTLLFTRFIDWPVPVLICARALLGAVGLWFYLKVMGWRSASRKAEPDGEREAASAPTKATSSGATKVRMLFWLILSGMLLAAHWMTFFQAGRLSTIALAMVAMYTYPLMTALVEPFLEGRVDIRRSGVDVALAALATTGIAIIGLSAASLDRMGLLFGLTSAALLTARNLIIRRRLHTQNGSRIMMIQLTAAGVLLLPALVFFPFSVKPGDALNLILLGLVFTAFSHTLLVRAILRMSARTASIIASIQPVYSAIFAYLILKESPTLATVLGGSIVVLCAILESARQRHREA